MQEVANHKGIDNQPERLFADEVGIGQLRETDVALVAVQFLGGFDTNLPLKGRKDLRGIIVPDKAEDAGGLSPGKDDNAVWRNKTRKAFDDLMED